MQTVTLGLVAIQRATPNLTFTFIEPGRAFIRRGSLLQIGDRLERVREFFLFSDCLVWLSRGGEWEGIAGGREEFLLRSGGSIFPPSANGLNVFGGRIRKTSEVDIGTPAFRRSASSGFAFSSANPRNSGVEEEKWWFRGKADLMDLEVVVPHVIGLQPGEEGRFDILNPEMSFALYAGKFFVRAEHYPDHCATENVEERNAWTSAIRTAKESRLVALNVTNRVSTLTSSSSTQHLRRALQALPYPPDDDRHDEPSGKKKRKDNQKDKNLERRGRVEHFVPAVWVPDAKAESCMRCGGVFGWRRRRHHCRLCGRCVCASCSGKVAPSLPL
jgi:FYVE/RhoGEF/PH domain-containing protein 5/6